MGQKISVLGKGIFELPQGALLQNFNFQGNVAVLKPDPNGPHVIGNDYYNVIDSVHLRGSSVTATSSADAVADLLKRNGAQLING